MKHLCCSRLALILLLFVSSLFGSLESRSVQFYYGKNISYPMVGIHDYIILNAENTTLYTHGFSLYKEKIYAHNRVQNRKDWAKTLNLRLQKELKDGFLNFYIDAENSTIEPQELADFVENFHKLHPKVKLILRGSDAFITKAYRSAVALVYESALKKSATQRKRITALGVDIIDIEFLSSSMYLSREALIEAVQKEGMIPFVGNRAFEGYGHSSKEPIKREVLTLIDESVHDRMLLSAHQHGAMPLEYLGYIQKLYDINKGIPALESMEPYVGVVIWLSKDYYSPQKLIEWVRSLIKMGIKVAFVNNFGASVDGTLLGQLGIETFDGDTSPQNKKTIIQRDTIIGFEIEPSLSENALYLKPKNSKALLTYEDRDKLQSIPAAITPWGGYAMAEAFMLELNEENIWIINPFEFFKQALRLKELPVPDPTTQNAKRLFFTHIDGDGIMNYVESNPELFSGDMIREQIVKRYSFPHSISIIGAEVAADGLYPEISTQIIETAKQIYHQKNVEPATHTFTHPFIWSKIENDDLDEEFRLKVKNYDFSLEYEIPGALNYINATLLKKGKSKANTVFWSGDCSPPEFVLAFVYKKGILNINGGYTVISNGNPWLTNVSSFGLERGEYYQIFTGAQNENVYTNDWLGPFWGFKKVVQTFKLTDSPKRLKPINVYYHLYSGSKSASLNALKYIFDWVLTQDTMPIYTSEYIPKVMDYYTVSLANEGDMWLVDGMRDLKTLRLEKREAMIDLSKAATLLGVGWFESHSYLSLDTHQRHLFSTQSSAPKRSYLMGANARVKSFTNEGSKQSYSFEGYVDLALEFHIESGCRVLSTPKATQRVVDGKRLSLKYQNIRESIVDVQCR